MRTAVANARTYRIQRIDQVADRPLAHARGPVEFVTAARKCQCRRQRPECGTGIAEKEARLPNWKPSAAAADL